MSLSEDVAIALTAPLLVVTTQIATALHKQLSTLLRARCIARISRMIMANNEPTDQEIRALRWQYTLSTIGDATRFIAEHIYGNALYRLVLIAEVCKVDYSSLQRSQLRDIATFIEAYPDRSVKYISRLSAPFSWYEAALTAQLMRRARAPIAYTPLLTSQNRNLQLVGIYLCELFSNVDAESHLQQLVKSEDEEVSYLALLTLCSIRGDISLPQVGDCLLRCSNHQRLAFVRHTIQACYSLNSCAKHLSDEEQTLFMQQLSSYKCQIVCN